MKVINLKLKSLFTKKNLFLIGFIAVNDKNSIINRNDIKLELNEKEYNIKFIFKRIKRIKFIRVLSNLYIVKIPLQDLMTGKIHNKPFFIYKGENEEIQKWSLRYSIFNNKREYLNSRIKVLKGNNTSVYVRQTAKNRLTITVREINKTDNLIEQIKLNLACFISKFLIRNKIIMYEKEAQRYEESASVVYEKLIDEGYKNIYYIIDKSSSQIKNVSDKYKRNFIYKYTFKHYLAFFSAKALIGSESPGHAIELRVANKYAAQRIYNDNFNYVFLQHGVMYMVSLNSRGRSFFRKNGGMPKNSKIVVSSKEEANHFVSLAGFNEEDLYITGLPKYDKNEWNENADKIVIMPTWRPWEYNLVRNDINNSPYYKLIKEIIEAIPEDLKDRIILMPHPLILNDLRQSELSKYILKEFVYNDVLKDTRVLITDYSSIAYDAFYRGSNVIFYWKEKDFCMEQYGGHLMLNEDNAFGTICYSDNQLKEIIREQYDNNQKDIYIEKYREIVQFNDNKNTERLISFLKRDKII